MKKGKRIVCILLVMLLAVGMLPYSSAVESRASLYLSSYDAYVYPNGGGSVSVWFDVDGTRTIPQLGVLTIRLQEKAPGATAFTTVETYRHRDYSNLLAYNVNTHDGHVDYAGTAGYTYRAYVTFWGGASDAEGDSRLYLTAEVTAR